MPQSSLEDPLGTARTCAGFANELEQMGYRIHVSSDLAELSALKLSVRNEPLAPFFDPEFCNLSPERNLWLSLISAAGKTTAIQAFRYDYVDTSLADWGPSYIIGLYMRRQEMLLPAHVEHPKSSIAERIRGKLIYQGEFWIDSQVRNRRVLDCFSRLGMLLSFIKWSPDAIWALCSNRMAANGYPTRMGYAHMEKGFLRWQWSSAGIDPVEWLNISERLSIERMINETIISNAADVKSRVLMPA